jgi:hypothetical protein
MAAVLLVLLVMAVLSIDFMALTEAPATRLRRTSARSASLQARGRSGGN